MAITFTGAGNSGGATNVTTTTAFAVGDYLVYFIAYGNSGGGGADPMSGTVTLSPASGELGAWASQQTGLNDPGAASAGLAVRCVAALVTAAIPSGTLITVTHSGVVASTRMALLVKVSSDGVTGYRTNNSATGTNYVASAGPAFTTPSINATEGVLCWAGYEWGAAIGGDSDSTNGTWSAVYGMYGGAASDAGQAAYVQSKVVTATGTQTWNPQGNTTDWIVGCLIFTETPHPSLTQAAYGFYADGTEAGSTALAAVNTAPSVNVASDVAMQLRVRIQSTSTVAVSTSDDFTLEYEKNGSGTWLPVDGHMAGYAGVSNGQNSFSAGDQVKGQSFMGDGRKLGKVGFWLVKGSEALGNFTAQLFAHAGTFGVSSVGTGAPLATSAPVALSSLGTGTVYVEFTFDGTFTMEAGTPYVIGAVTSMTSVGAGAAYSPVGMFPGNQATRGAGTGGAWTAYAGQDASLRVLAVPNTVVPYDSANLTDAAATTNRLGAGTGSFQAGKLSEDGLIDNLGWTGNNYTELLYSIQLKSADLTNGDTLRFRVARIGYAAWSYHYPAVTQTPTINVTLTLPNTATASHTWTVSPATGSRQTRGQATSTHNWTVAPATGKKVMQSNAVVTTHTWTNTATGSQPKKGQATAAHNWSVAPATGMRVTRGQATSTHTWTMDATGVRPVLPVMQGTATARHDWTISASGITTIFSPAGDALWKYSEIPTDTEVEADTASILVGTRFTVDEATTIRSIRYYRPPFYGSGVTLQLRVHKEP